MYSIGSISCLDFSDSMDWMKKDKRGGGKKKTKKGKKEVVPKKKPFNPEHQDLNPYTFGFKPLPQSDIYFVTTLSPSDAEMIPRDFQNSIVMATITLAAWAVTSEFPRALYYLFVEDPEMTRWIRWNLEVPF